MKCICYINKYYWYDKLIWNVCTLNDYNLLENKWARGDGTYLFADLLRSFLCRYFRLWRHKMNTHLQFGACFLLLGGVGGWSVSVGESAFSEPRWTLLELSQSSSLLLLRETFSVTFKTPVSWPSANARTAERERGRAGPNSAVQFPATPRPFWLKGLRRPAAAAAAWCGFWSESLFFICVPWVAFFLKLLSI